MIPQLATTGPLMWYLNRGTGVGLLVALTLSTCLGILSVRASAGGRVPAFVRQAVHRNLSLISVVLLAGHVTTAVVDEYVDIRWWQAVSPIGATYRPVWLGLGTLSLDLVAIVVLSSLLRAHSSRRLWRNLHWLAYLAWGVAIAHSAGIGTDAGAPWGRWLGYGCIGTVVLSVLVRVIPRRTPASDGAAAEVAPLPLPEPVR
jgi:methionine sulfoxide reductase heme-binding subunit